MAVIRGDCPGEVVVEGVSSGLGFWIYCEAGAKMIFKWGPKERGLF